LLDDLMTDRLFLCDIEVCVRMSVCVNCTDGINATSVKLKEL